MHAIRLGGAVKYFLGLPGSSVYSQKTQRLTKRRPRIGFSYTIETSRRVALGEQAEIFRDYLSMNI